MLTALAGNGGKTKTQTTKKILPCQVLLLLSSVQNCWSNWRGMGVTAERIWSSYRTDRYMSSWLEQHTLKTSGQILDLN